MVDSFKFFSIYFYCYANFSIAFGLNFRRLKSLLGGKLLQGAPPPVEESQKLGHLKRFEPNYACKFLFLS